uniref:Zinc finger protein 84 n=1 Tax=Culex pipiens TaxID=7175 RepID=A0A8D8DVC9_CULPI
MSGSVKVCRICLMESELDSDMVSIFTEREALNEVVANMIIDCFSVLVSEQDGYSPWMCGPCLTRLEDCYLLRSQYVESCRKVDERSTQESQNVEELPESIIEEESIIDEESIIEEEIIAEEVVQEYKIPETPSESAGETDSEQSSSEFQKDVHYKVIDVDGVCCCECNEMFSDEASLIQHSENDHRPESTELKTGMLQCDICYAMFSTNGRLQRHTKRRYSRVLYECLECQAIFRSNARLQTHLIKHDRKSSRALKDYPCCIRCCPETFPTQEHLVEHAQDNHGPLRSINKSTRESDVHVCQVCLNSFSTKNALIKHRLAKQDTPPSVKGLVCSTCGKVFKALSLLQAHENKHKGINPFPCNECSESFHSYPMLQRHKRRFHVDKHRHQCPNCPKSFAHKSQLKTHQVYHLDLKPYKCETCPETFRLKNQLKIHNRRHTGERPFRCQYCQMGFSHGTDRKRHEMAAHTGEKPHKCRICKGAFVRHQQLVAHMVSGHGRTREAPFRCEFCKQDFRQSAELERHEHQDHGIQDVGTIVANGVEMQYAVAYV